ncbi:hypothetical protein OCU04_004895 [Sclerotinia nivalis]|uniref:Uncharacterized protein n=1 Tax=Sclerotinia nivalis TaxID=352851 RepID=A0A9X0ARQ4_9HELO|nr:hypothetical protein OCU04_004895 [Sclerotinia nivalis]
MFKEATRSLIWMRNPCLIFENATEYNMVTFDLSHEKGYIIRCVPDLVPIIFKLDDARRKAPSELHDTDPTGNTTEDFCHREKIVSKIEFDLNNTTMSIGWTLFWQKKCRQAELFYETPPSRLPRGLVVAQMQSSGFLSRTETSLRHFLKSGTNEISEACLYSEYCISNRQCCKQSNKPIIKRFQLAGSTFI